MICYRDMTFCPYWRTCSAVECRRALTKAVAKQAKRLEYQIAFYIEKPECYEPKENGK